MCHSHDHYYNYIIFLFPPKTSPGSAFDMIFPTPKPCKCDPIRQYIWQTFFGSGWNHQLLILTNSIHPKHEKQPSCLPQHRFGVKDPLCRLSFERWRKTIPLWDYTTIVGSTYKYRHIHFLWCCIDLYISIYGLRWGVFVFCPILHTPVAPL